MKKYLLSLFLILTLLCSFLWADFGQFGTGTGARDTVYLWFDAFDSLGYQVNVDTVMWIIRYGSTLVDSTRKVGTTSDDALSPGRYLWQKIAYDGIHQGSYNVEFRWSVNGGKKYHKEKNYTVFSSMKISVGGYVSPNFSDIYGTLDSLEFGLDMRYAMGLWVWTHNNTGENTGWGKVINDMQKIMSAGPNFTEKFYYNVNGKLDSVKTYISGALSSRQIYYRPTLTSAPDSIKFFTY